MKNTIFIFFIFVSFNCFGQLGVKSGIIHSKSLESNVPYIQIDLADYNFSWLISTGINYSTFEQLLPIDSKKNVDVRTHRIGIQFRITSKNIESFIKKKINDTIVFINRPISFCGTPALNKWHNDKGLRFRPYLTIVPRFDINSSSSNSDAIKNGVGFSSFLGVNFYSLNLLNSKLNFYTEGGCHYNFFTILKDNLISYSFTVGIKLNLNLIFDSDHEPNGYTKYNAGF